MAILALATSLEDLRARLGRIVVGYTKTGEPVTAEQLHGAGSMAVIMRDAIKPNLLQTLENTPVIVHAGPFGNIAHGNSSVVGDLIGIHGGDYLITEAGFGADMGAERFFNIKCRASGLVPDAAVLVATVRALKAHSGKYRIVAGKAAARRPACARTPTTSMAGAANLRKQIENVKAHGVTPVVAINGFPTDHASEHDAIRRVAEEMGARVAVCTHFADGGAGATDLAHAVVEACEEPSGFHFLYPDDGIAARRRSRRSPPTIYGAERVEYTPAANRQLDNYERQRVRPPAGVHRQDPPVDLRRPVAEGRADRSHVDACARSGRPSAPASCTRSAARCARCRASVATRRRRSSTSTRTARSWG